MARKDEDVKSDDTKRVPTAIWSQAFIVPVLATDSATSALLAPGGAIASSVPFALLQGVGGLVYMLGLVLLGIAVFRFRVMARWIGILMAAAPIFLLLPMPEAPGLTRVVSASLVSVVGW